MKVTDKATGDQLVQKLAEHVCSCKAWSKTVVAADSKVDTKEEAKQCAITYWMMGWGWDEIESVLEDSEYGSDIVKYALKEAKEYASKVLNEGPFAIFKEGQGIKLINGAVGALEGRYADHIDVQMGAPNGIVKITEKQIDLEASKKLGSAFDLRSEAEKLLAATQKDSLIAVIEEVKNARVGSTRLDQVLASLDYIKQSVDELKTAGRQIYEGLKTPNRLVGSTGKEREFFQYIFAAGQQEREVLNDAFGAFFASFKDNLAELHDHLLEGNVITAEVADFLNTEFGKIVDCVMRHIDSRKTAMEVAKKYNAEFDANLANNWAEETWNETKRFAEKWANEIFPSLRKGNATIRAFLDAASKAAQAKKINEVLQSR